MALEDEVKALKDAVLGLTETIREIQGLDRTTDTPVKDVTKADSKTTAKTTESVKGKSPEKIVAEPVAETAIEPEEHPTVTFEEVKVLFLECCEAKLDAALAVLKDYKAAKLSDISSAQYGEVFTKLKAI